jgi:hypothetical protein
MLKSVDIFGKKYKISSNYKKLKIPSEQIDPSEDGFLLYGYCLREEGLIFINPNLSEGQKYRTLLHEMGHGLMYRNGILFTGQIPPELEEQLVENFSNMHFEFMQQWIAQLLKLDDTIIREYLKMLVKS